MIYAGFESTLVPKDNEKQNPDVDDKSSKPSGFDSNVIK